jgi:chaperonin GroES
MFNYKPTYDKIIVKPIDEVEEKTRQGLIIPISARQQNFKTAVVVATGPGYIDHGNTVAPQSKVGDKVIYSGLAALAIKIDNVEYFIMPDKEILAVVGQEEKIN